ncbi:MAG: hypothetical protein FJ276_35435 [Planctomycetes bacterium]|nr:hypothetical protein [Planctomycetota bacterium]
MRDSRALLVIATLLFTRVVSCTRTGRPLNERLQAVLDTRVHGTPCFLASGLGGQILGVVPSLDLDLVIQYEAESPLHPVPGTAHDDMHLFELVVQSVTRLSRRWTLHYRL